jgi:hypothetical protein
MYYKMSGTPDTGKGCGILWVFLALLMIAGFGYGIVVLLKKK